MDDLIINEFKQNSIFRLEESLRMIRLAFEKVEDDLVWKRPIPKGMSLGNQILHICGNMTQYVIASLGEQEDNRQRAKEFDADLGYNTIQLLEKLTSVVAEAKEIIVTTSQEKFVKIRDVQGFSLSGIGVLLHAVEHFSYHTGQIAFWIKQETQEDLGFYTGIDLTVKNK